MKKKSSDKPHPMLHGQHDGKMPKMADFEKKGKKELAPKDKKKAKKAKKK